MSAIVCAFQISLAEEADEQKTAFSSVISFGRIVKRNESQVGYSYSNTKINYNFLQGSNSASSTSKIGEYESKVSMGALTYQYGLTDKFVLGLSLLNDFSNTTQFTFTSAAKSSGYTDSSSSRSGMRDPALMAGAILKESYDFKLYILGSYSPKSAERTKTNAVNGGQSGSIQLATVKSFGDLEFGFSFGYLTYGVRTQPIESGGTAESSGGNILNASLAFNYFLNREVSILLQTDRSMTDLSTTKYSTSASSTDTASYNLAINYLGLQVALMKDFSFNVKYLQIATDAVKSTTGTSVLTLDQASSNAYSLGFNYYF